MDGPFLSNYNGTTNALTGGTYTANGGNISFLASTDRHHDAIRSSYARGGRPDHELNHGSPALANLSSITSTGVLTTTATFNQPGAFSMAGALNILPNTSFSVGSLAQIKNNALTGGQWVLDSDFNITGTPANIVTNSATLTLSGGTFFNTSNGTNAFANLSANKKTLRILNFAHFNTAGTLTNTGQMTVAKGCKLTIGGTGTSYSQTSGKTTLDGMLIGTAMINGGTLLGRGFDHGKCGAGQHDRRDPQPGRCGQVRAGQSNWNLYPEFHRNPDRCDRRHHARHTVQPAQSGWHCERERNFGGNSD